MGPNPNESVANMQGTHQKPVKNAEDDEGMISFGRLCTNFVSVVPKM